MSEGSCDGRRREACANCEAEAREREPFRIFLSYSRIDAGLVRPVVGLLRATRGLVFQDEDSLHAGQPWRPHFHDLRHHGATMALNAGFTAPIVMALGGWKTERMMRRYAAVTDATLRAAAEAVSGGASGRSSVYHPPAPCR